MTTEETSKPSIPRKPKTSKPKSAELWKIVPQDMSPSQVNSLIEFALDPHVPYPLGRLSNEPMSYSPGEELLTLSVRFDTSRNRSGVYNVVTHRVPLVDMEKALGF